MRIIRAYREWAARNTWYVALLWVAIMLTIGMIVAERLGG